MVTPPGPWTSKSTAIKEECLRQTREVSIFLSTGASKVSDCKELMDAAAKRPA